MKKAFTLLELIAVIVITGILVLIGTDVILNIYKSYLQSRAINTLEAQTEIVLEQISKRLMFRIKESTIGRRTAIAPLFVSTQDPNLNNTYTILEWISYSYESFQDGGWSGFIDLNSPNTNRIGTTNTGTLETPGSNLLSADQTISDLTRINAITSRADLSNNTVGIFFRGLGANVNTSFGYDGTTPNSIGIATRTTTGGTTSNTNLTISNYSRTDISEFYYLLHTAYAVVPGANSPSGDFDLFLHYDYRPWIGQRYNDADTKVALLATNVTRFNFTELDGVMVLKLCIRDAGRSLSNGEEETTVCKTKAIY